ncbi:Gldg family protein [Novosphingobium sp. M1R2S20]|uniref:DUF4350 domain-containing protein n=1 Tax=Novosphingobium rhizovicinum TaxID=3228928 RepID=A0ABV3R8U9_9SPHN
MFEQRGRVVPLDTLAGPDGKLSLPRNGLLILAQPRALSPDENVALDAWVRSGGRLLLFADPMLTADSEYPLGDPRRPQSMAMLSPILTHWGVELEFDVDQPAGERAAEIFGATLPVNLPGQFRVLPDSNCRIEGGGLAVDCKIGEGRVIAIADAALFDGDNAGRDAPLRAFLDRIAS